MDSDILSLWESAYEVEEGLRDIKKIVNLLPFVLSKHKVRETTLREILVADSL